MILTLNQVVQRQDKLSNRWSLPFIIDSENKLNYHQGFVDRGYQYRINNSSYIHEVSGCIIEDSKVL